MACYTVNIAFNAYIYIYIYNFINGSWFIPVAVPSQAWVYGRSLTGIAGSNPAAGMDARLLSAVC